MGEHCRRTLRRAALWILVAFCLSAMAPAPVSAAQAAKYVFYFIGDGMGIPQRTATEAFGGRRLTMDSFPAQGMTTTRANDRFITGSAAAATALACGQKTNINYIGVDPDYRPVKSVAEMARDKGWKVGIVSSVSIDHATPAGFYAHVKTRKMYYEIERDLAASGFDYFGGGGFKDPMGKKSKNPQGSSLEFAKSKGYRLVTDKAEFLKLKPGQKILAWNDWLQDDEALPYAMDRRTQDISLAEFTKKGIELLDNPKGFFLMVEGGKIDWACHANDAAAALRDTMAFDDAVKEAVAFAETHPAETLIVVTGDHECGGLTLGFAGTKYESYFDLLGGQNVSFQKFSDEIVGGYKKACGTNCSFDAVRPMITRHFGLKFEGDAKADLLVLHPYEVQMLQEAYGRTMDGVDTKDPQAVLLYGGYDPLTVTVTHLLNQKAGLGWTSYQHTAVPVATSAMGVRAELFNGFYDNTDVAFKVMEAMGVQPKVYHLQAETRTDGRLAAR
ncbi:MAG: alkaline phosphatase [Desulfovibrionaceae bacterium]|jgi:alkaline phosphatase|nr:alkaline phosphatase [Desulfovibrionaceae bacterium]